LAHPFVSPLGIKPMTLVLAGSIMHFQLSSLTNMPKYLIKLTRTYVHTDIFTQVQYLQIKTDSHTKYACLNIAVLLFNTEIFQIPQDGLSTHTLHLPTGFTHIGLTHRQTYNSIYTKECKV